MPNINYDKLIIWSKKEAKKIKPSSNFNDYINIGVFTAISIIVASTNSSGFLGVTEFVAATVVAGYVSKKISNYDQRNKNAYDIRNNSVEKSILTLAKDKADFKAELQIEGIDNTIYATGDIAIAKFRDSLHLTEFNKGSIHGVSKDGTISSEEAKAFFDAFPEALNNSVLKAMFSVNATQLNAEAPMECEMLAAPVISNNASLEKSRTVNCYFSTVRLRFYKKANLVNKHLK